jgi:uncharacterized membrane protein YtjA (UPF0391 family)
MFASTLAFLAVSIAAACCGYCGLATASAATFAQDAFLISTVCFAIFALFVIAEPDASVFARSVRVPGRRPRHLSNVDVSTHE